jgi:hypothetical protein
MKRKVIAMEKADKRPAKLENAAPGNGKPPAARHASDEQFKKAHRKTSKLHAGLFRRLAE